MVILVIMERTPRFLMVTLIVSGFYCFFLFFLVVFGDCGV